MKASTPLKPTVIGSMTALAETERRESDFLLAVGVEAARAPVATMMLEGSPELTKESPHVLVKYDFAEDAISEENAGLMTANAAWAHCEQVMDLARSLFVARSAGRRVVRDEVLRG